jgi:hypothetical protein
VGGGISETRDDPAGPETPTRWPVEDGFVDADAEAVTADGSGEAGDTPQVDGAVGRVLGDYLILERLGSGGMGIVYRALQRDARRLVALKLIREDWWGDSTEVSNRRAETRFRNEAQALAQLEHDHIVPIYDVGHADGVVYFSMRLIKGRTLGEAIRERGPLEPRRAAAYLEPIARAVQYAHDRGILHRDLKPSNIMVDEQDRPYLIDLGLCKSLEATDATSLVGRPMGTAEYMAPEQARGDRQVGPAVDVYGLGATLLTLLTGAPPFSGNAPAVVLRQVVEEEPDWPRERDRPVGRELKAICLKCLEKDPARRFRSAGELAEVLRRYLDDEPTGVVLPGPGTRLSRWLRRQPWRAAATGAILLAGLIAAAAWVYIDRRDRRLADAFVNDLVTIPWDELSRKARDLDGPRDRVEAMLRARLDGGAVDPEMRSRIAVVLLPAEPARAAELADRLLSCGPEEHRAIREALRTRRGDVVPRLSAVVEGAGADPGRRVRASAALIAFDGPEPVAPDPFADAEPAWVLLRAAEVPDLRVELMDWLVRSRVRPETIAGRLEREPNPSARRALCQVLADLGEEGRVPATIPPALPARLEVLYRDDPDPGVRSSVGYLLLRWGMTRERAALDAERAGQPPIRRRWLVNSIGQTLAIVGPVEPSPASTPRRLAIATTETTIEQYGRFDPGHRARAERDHRTTIDPDAPVGAVSYDEAARFCNWLSESEGFPAEDWCYLPGGAAGHMVLAPDSPSRRGYRLPTLREWEMAARAGTATDRYFGRSVRHAGAYAWYSRNTDNHAEPVGRKRPNDFGLFDVLGNLDEWCYNPDPPHNDSCDCKARRGAECRKVRLVSIRGGSFYQPEGYLSVVGFNSTVDYLDPGDSLRFIGFRVARSVP